MSKSQSDRPFSGKPEPDKAIVRPGLQQVDEGGDVRRSISATALTRLLEQTARGLHSMGHDEDLFPGQWSALRYFATADDTHCTAMGLARHQGLAFGPVSRSVRTLIIKGLLKKAGSAGRGRAERIKLTAAGRKMLARDPLRAIETAIDELSEQEKEALALALDAALRVIQRRHPAPKNADTGNGPR